MSGEEFDPGETAALILRLEQDLLDPSIRRDATRMQELLADDFLEFGSSGRVWTRDRTIDLLRGETFDPPAVEDLSCRFIAAGVALVTYRTVRIDAETGARRVVLRSSIWIEESGHWRMRFHQGTPSG